MSAKPEIAETINDIVPAERPYDVVLLGHFALDKLVEHGQVRVTSGGAVYYGGMALARLGFRVAVITKLAAKDFPRLQELRDAGITVFAAPAPQTSGMENIYAEDLDHRICRPLGFAGRFSLAEIPEVAARALLIGPIIAGEFDLPLLEELTGRFRRQGARIALDLQGFIRFIDGPEVVFRRWPGLERGLQLVDLLKADDAEAEFVTGVPELRQAAQMLAEYGPHEVLVTYAAGVMVYDRDRKRFFTAAFRPRELRGRTGRGDTCFASYVGFRLQHPPQRAVQLAAAVTSLKLERPGPFSGSRADVERFLKAGVAGEPLPSESRKQG